MDTRQEIRNFLTSRRARLTPEHAGIAAANRRRRVAGLRREEVALLAGISVDYYTRIERGNLAGVSQSVLEMLSRALQLDTAERAHLLDLARAAQPSPGLRPHWPPEPPVRPTVQRTIQAMTGAAAFLRNGRLDILAANDLGRALYSDMYDTEGTPNTARFVFLDPRARRFYVDWGGSARQCAAVLRAEAARSPDDSKLSKLIAELSAESEDFRAYWSEHDVHFHLAGTKHFRHPMVGHLSLDFERIDLAADPGLYILAYTAEAGSMSEEALELLGSWAGELEDRHRLPATRDD